MSLRRSVVVLAIGLGATALSTPAAADTVYHSQHVDLVPVGNAPLISGFVENIHMDGPVVYAHERYVLNGALSSTSFQVTLLVFPFDVACAGTPVAIPTATLTTNEKGNGAADAFFHPVDVPAVLRGASHGLVWQLSVAGVVDYETNCSIVTLD